ncbi:MAG: hypothetical protein QXT19_00940 [Candidatus Woesearchaeota archaeon]
MTKKGQLTLFIIVGLLLLIGISIYVYLTTRAAIAPVEAERIRMAEVPAEMQPLRDFIQDCLKITAKDGLMRLGQRGGYISPRHPYNTFEPTAGRALQLAPESQLIVPYWWHMNAKNTCKKDCTFATERPTLEQIKLQLDTYITRTLPKCLGELKQFKEQQFTITPTGKMKTETQITDENIIVLLTYPLEVKRAGETFKLDKYAAELPVAFKKLYSLATKITALEAEHSFLERATRALIDVFGRADENALPPVSDLEFKYGPGTIWTKYGVLQKIREMLASHIPLLKVTDTSNYIYLTAPAGKDAKLYDALYNRGFTIPLFDSTNRGISAKFAYLPWWKPYMDLNCNGQLCQAEGFNNLLVFAFGIKRYNFAYDISYPVIVELTDTGAFGGEGYTFRIALEANLRNNEPLAKLGTLPEMPALEERRSMLCDPDQRASGKITINAVTSAGQPVDGAEITYACGTESCHIGSTAKGTLVATFPRCIGGFVSASHPDYAPATMPLDITDNSDRTIDLTLNVAYPVNFSVKKWLLKKETDPKNDNYGNWDVDTSQVFNQGPREQTFIMLERKGPEFEEPVVILGEVCGAPVSKANIPCGTPPADNSKNIPVYAGDYHVTIYSFLYPSPDLVIPAEKRYYRKDMFRKGSYTLPEVRFTQEQQMLSGYAEYDWTITENELKNAKNIEFTYINFALDKVLPIDKRKIEDVQVMGNLASYSEQYKDILTPRIT